MNSRLTFNNQPELNRLLNLNKTIAAEKHTRLLVIVQFAPIYWLKKVAKINDWDYLPAQAATDRADQIAALLGSERDVAVLELGPSPDLGLTAALAGTVKAGGMLVLSGPPRLKTKSDGTDSRQSMSRLLRLACALADKHPLECQFVNFSANKADAAERAIESKSEPAALLAGSESQQQINRRQALAEQNKLLAIACQELMSANRCCVVIKGRRGRGKSTLMARIATQMSAAGTSVQVTAKHPSGLAAYRKQAGQVGEYVSPELAAQGAGDTLFVDEAASFSISQLQRYARLYHNLILTSTVDGYEAAGRALDLRLFTDTTSGMPSVHVLQPLIPWRWAAGDPLETFIDELLMITIDSDMSVDSTPASNHRRIYQFEKCKPRKVQKHELAVNESLLRQVHSLLLATHYQSGTKDLEHLLDAPTIQVWIQQHDHDVVGVLLLELEGEIEQCLHDAVLKRQRRLPNQLLPQLLAQTANSTLALGERYARILRLAILPELRRAGLATALLNKTLLDIGACYQLPGACRSAQADIDAVGASFADDQASVAFWKNQGFLEFHRGFRNNPRTGKQAITVLKSNSTCCSRVLRKAVEIHGDNENSRKSGPSGQMASKDNLQLSRRDVELLMSFANGHRTQHDTSAALQRFQHIAGPLPKKLKQMSRQDYQSQLRLMVRDQLNTLQ